MDKQKKTKPVDNYDKQIRIVGLLALALAVVGVIAGIFLYTQSNPGRPSATGGGEFVQLKGELDRMAPLMETISIQENETMFIVVFYEGEPKEVWSERERDQMDLAMLRIMEEATVRDKTVLIVITQPNAVVATNGQSVDAIFAVANFLCLNREKMAEINWSTADHQTLIDHCALYPVNNYWGNAEAILWPPAQ